MSGSDLKSGARYLIASNLKKVLLISLLYVILSSIISQLAFRIMNFSDQELLIDRLASGELPGFGMLFRDFSFLGLLLAFALFLLDPLLSVGFISFCMKHNRGQSFEIRDLFNGFVYFGKILLLFFASTLLIFLWSLLFIIPGIVAAYKYRLIYYIFLDDTEKSVRQCLYESKKLMRGKKMDLLIIDLSFFGWYLLNIVTMFTVSFTPIPFAFPIILIWLSPYLGLTRAGFYDDRITNLSV